MMKRIGLLMDFFRPEILEGVRAYCNEHGLLLDARWSVRADWMEEDVGWDGLVFSLVDQPKVAARIKGWNIAKVSLHPLAGCPSVTTDWRACGMLTVDALLEVERRPVLGVVWDRPESMPHEFAAGCVERLRERGESELWQPCRTRDNRRTVASINEALMQKIREISAPVAIAQPHSGVVFELELALAKQGLRVPEDVSLVTIDKDVQRTAELAPVPISTVRLDEWNQGYRAAAWVDAILQRRRLPEQTLLIPPLNVEHRDSTMRKSRRDPFVDRALELIKRLHPHRMEVADLARRLNLGRRTLEIRFRAATGHTIQREIVQQRVETAKRLLLQDELGMPEIAERSGFSSIHYFSNVFKKETGETPGQLRARK
jgi:LacI family transcriptional regulator